MAQEVKCLGAEFRYPAPGAVTHFSKLNAGASVRSKELIGQPVQPIRIDISEKIRCFLDQYIS